MEVVKQTVSDLKHVATEEVSSLNICCIYFNFQVQRMKCVNKKLCDCAVCISDTLGWASRRNGS